MASARAQPDAAQRFAAVAFALLAACVPAETPDPIAPLATATAAGRAPELLDVAIAGERAAACTGVAGLVLYDLGRPEAPREHGRIVFEAGSGVFPRCRRVAWSPDGRRLFATSHGDQIQPEPFVSVIAWEQRDEAREIGFVRLDFEPAGLAVTGRHVLVAGHDAGLVVFERGGDDALVEVGRAGSGGNAWDVAPRGATAWVADATGALLGVSLDDPRAPQVRHRIVLPGPARHVALHGGRAAVALGVGGVALVALDGEPPALEAVLPTPGSATAVAWGASGRALLAAAWHELRLWDTSDASPRLVAREAIGGPAARTLGVATRGREAWAATWTGLAGFRFTSSMPAQEAPAPAAVEAAATSDRALQVGDALDPALVRPGADGPEQRLVPDGERPRLLVWFATFCPVCSLEIPDLIWLARAQGFDLIGLSPGGIAGRETPAHLAALRRQTGARFPFVRDRELYAHVAWPEAPSPFPRQLLLAPDGRIAWLSAAHRPAALVAALEALRRSAPPARASAP